MFINKPNLPKSPVNAVLVDYRAENTIKALEKSGIKVYKTPELDIAYPAVSGHPDMLFHHLDAHSAVVAPEAHDYFKKMFPAQNIIKGSTRIGNTYPGDIAYNIARINNFAFHKEKYTEKTIHEYFKKNSVNLININQGYSKCSICIVNENAIITADISIAENAKKNGIDVLLIREGHIKLKDFRYGFIGGASGLISGEILAFNGDISSHPDYKNIKKFCDKNKVSVFSLTNEMLEDIGSVLPLF